MDNVIAYANDHIEREYRIHVLKEELPSSQSLSSIPETSSTVQVPVSATATVPIPSITEDQASIADSSDRENSVATSFLEAMKISQESMKISQESQAKTNDVNTQVLHQLLDKMALLNNATQTDKSFERITTKILLDQKATDLPAIPESRTQITIGIWYETFERTLRASPWDIDGTSILEMYLPPVLSEASESYRI